MARRDVPLHLTSTARDAALAERCCEPNLHRRPFVPLPAHQRCSVRPKKELDLPFYYAVDKSADPRILTRD